MAHNDTRLLMKRPLGILFEFSFGSRLDLFPNLFVVAELTTSSTPDIQFFPVSCAQDHQLK
jgi:hypothetical protein